MGCYFEFVGKKQQVLRTFSITTLNTTTEKKAFCEEQKRLRKLRQSYFGFDLQNEKYLNHFGFVCRWTNLETKQMFICCYHKNFFTLTALSGDIAFSRIIQQNPEAFQFEIVRFFFFIVSTQRFFFFKDSNVFLILITQTFGKTHKTINLPNLPVTLLYTYFSH